MTRWPLRPAGPADAAEVLDLVQAAYRTEGGWTTEARLVGGPRLDRAGYDALLARPHSVVLVAERAGRIVGCVHLQQLDAATCALGLLSVRPADQAGGIGRGLLEGAEAYARHRWGTAVMAMRVVSARAELLAWYERRGYRRTGRVEPFAPGAGERFLQGPLAFERLEKRLGP